MFRSSSIKPLNTILSLRKQLVSKNTPKRFYSSDFPKSYETELIYHPKPVNPGEIDIASPEFYWQETMVNRMSALAGPYQDLGQVSKNVPIQQFMYKVSDEIMEMLPLEYNLLKE